MIVESRQLLQYLESILGSTAHLSHVIALILAGVVMLIIEMFSHNKNFLPKTIISVSFLGISLVLIQVDQFQGELFSGFLVVDGLSRFMTSVLIFLAIVVLCFPARKNDLRNRGEYHFFIMTMLIGGFMVTNTLNLLVAYLAIETISISSYVLTTFGFSKKNYEAGIKYLLFGALSSGIMLYGISLLYGFSGSLDIIDMTDAVYSAQSNLAILAVVLTLAGIFFKLALIPMHIWVPDVYEATPPSIVALFSTVPKLSVVVFAYRLTSELFLTWAGSYVLMMIAVLAIISMFVGNLGAIWQKNVKRLMGYSSVAHAGFLVIGMLTGTIQGLQALMFYVTVYGVMNLAVFYFIDEMETKGFYSVNDYSGIGRMVPVYGAILVILMIALTGLPPTGGFTAKFLLFSSLWDAYSTTSSQHLLWLFIFGLLNSVIALFYYLKIPYYMIFKASSDKDNMEVSKINVVLLSTLTLVVLITFFKADLLVNIINKFNFAF